MVLYCISGAPADACSSAPCRNGGTCDVDGSDYRCTCAQGYEGRNCERREYPTWLDIQGITRADSKISTEKWPYKAGHLTKEESNKHQICVIA